MDRKLIEKLGALVFPQGGSNLWGALSGPHNATKRQSVVALLTGVKLPKSKCGYHVARDAMIATCGIASNCISSEDHAIGDTIRATLAYTGETDEAYSALVSQVWQWDESEYDRPRGIELAARLVSSGKYSPIESLALLQGSFVGDTIEFGSEFTRVKFVRMV